MFLKFKSNAVFVDRGSAYEAYPGRDGDEATRVEGYGTLWGLLCSICCLLWSLWSSFQRGGKCLIFISSTELEIWQWNISFVEILAYLANLMDKDKPI